MMESLPALSPERTLSAAERLELIRTLNGLPLSQLLELEFALDVPKGIVPPPHEMQGIRTRALLDWVDGSTGIGWDKFLDVLREVTGFSLTCQFQRLKVVIEGDIAETDAGLLLKVLAEFQHKAKAPSLKISSIQKGSIELILQGTPEELERLRQLIDSGQLAEVAGKRIGVAMVFSDLSNADLSGVNLSGVNLSNADLRGANLSNANLSDANLSNANLSNADLSYADLSGAIFSGAIFSGAIFSRAIFSGAIFSGAIFSGAIFSYSNLNGVNLSNADLSNVNLSYAKLSNADLRWANLSNADLRWVHLSNADLSNADLNEANLRNGNLSNANLSGVILSGANLSNVNLRWANLSRAILREANLRNADLFNADLCETILGNAILSGAIFGSNLGLQKSDEAALIQRGAIFRDNPDSDVRVFV